MNQDANANQTSPSWQQRIVGSLLCGLGWHDWYETHSKISTADGDLRLVWWKCDRCIASKVRSIREWRYVWTEQPPVDNAHVAPECEQFGAPNDRISRERSELAESDGSTSGGK
jgi:hypothetical protein